MPGRSDQPIHLDQDYPCPCNCKGRLSPITLTEALGCFECQRIFVVVEDGWAIAKLSANSPRQLRWRWTGEEWYLASSPWPSYFLAIALAITLGLVCMGIFLTLLPPPSAKPLMRLMLTGIAFMLVLVLGTFLSHRPWRG